MAKQRGWVETFEHDQLVVALSDLPVVVQTLGSFGLGWKQIDKSAALGMALVRVLDDISKAARELEQRDVIGPELKRYQQARRQALPGPVPDLDLLIRGIRAQLAHQYPGWEVTIGKNFGPSLVKGYPHVNGGGNGEPKPTDAALSGPVCRRRPNPHRGRGVRVGLLDTRIFPDPGLAGHYLTGPRDVLKSSYERPFTMFDGHCTFVSSCVLQQAPAAELVVRRVLNKNGEGWAWEAATAMAEVAQLGLDVVNLSFGEFLTDDNTAPMVLEAAVKRFSPETVVVAAAGNNGDVKELTDELVHEGVKTNSASYPAALPDVVGVGALDGRGRRAAFTPHPAPWIALLATGVDLVGAYVQGKVTVERRDKDGNVIDKKNVSFPGKAIWEGCSFAAGVVSGEIAARTIPGRRSARQALNELLHPGPGTSCSGIVPNRLDDLDS
jgi:hypothetical protein